MMMMHNYYVPNLTMSGVRYDNDLSSFAQFISYSLFPFCRSGVKHTNVLLRGSVFRNFSINYFTYGFPVCILCT